MDKAIYGLCAVTSLGCATLLLRKYLQTHHRLLLWSGLCFVGFTVNNVLLVLDRLVFTTVDMSIWRLATALIAVVLLLIGLVVESSS